MSMKEFSIRIKNIAEKIPEKAHEIVKKVALAVDQTVVMATPVDTGRARANWQVATGTPLSSTRDPFVPGQQSSTAGQNTAMALEQGRTVINASKPGTEIHITNNLAYIGRLNEGHSAQAPAGFVERAIDNGVLTIQTSKLLD
jgi:hypothetical protein